MLKLSKKKESIKTEHLRMKFIEKKIQKKITQACRSSLGGLTCLGLKKPRPMHFG